MVDHILVWVLFNFFILILLALDLGVFHRKAHVVRAKEAALWSAFWIVLSILFGVGIYYSLGKNSTLEYFTAYFIEKSLSLDNLFVIVLIFKMTRIPRQYQHRVLFWGVLGAIVMRGIMILAGVKLIELFHWMIYVFGFFLIYAGISTLINHLPGEEAPENPIVRWLKRHLKVADKIHGQHFFILQKGKRLATPLFLSLLFIEIADLFFAVDSIPAILAISRDPFIIYSSNIFAILGLRSLYFLLADLIPRFVYIHYALAFILGFVGLKMLISDFYHFPIEVTFSIIALVIIISIIASIVRNRFLGKN